MEKLLNTIKSFGNPRLILVGDFMLDEYVYGDVSRISPEAPVPVLKIDSREHRCGGAGNVAAMVSSLGGVPLCVGLVGCDSNKLILVDQLCEYGSDTSGLVEVEGRPTIVKTRFVGRAQHKNPHQILRADEEDSTPASPELQERILSSVKAELERGGSALMVIQDHGKGMLDNGFAEQLIALASQHGCDTVVDPCPINDYSRYAGAAVITPNRFEASLASGIEIVDDQSAFEAAKKLTEIIGAKAVAITLDKDGMFLYEKCGRNLRIPTSPRNVYDGTGAGDAVIAMFSLAVACDSGFDTALALANVAGGLEVERFGVVPIARDEIINELRRRECDSVKLIQDTRLQPVVAQKQRVGEKVVFTNGCFDLLHAGHVAYLKQARAEGDCLIVGINSDASVSALKGPERPIISQDHRAAMLSALECVDYVVVYDDDTPLRLLEMFRPDVLVKGGSTPVIVGQEEVEAYGGIVKRLDLVQGLSTSAIIQKIEEDQNA